MCCISRRGWGSVLGMTTRAMSIQDIISDITHGCDGPVTKFVIVARAMDLVAKQPELAENAANAVYELVVGQGAFDDESDSNS